MKDDCEAVINRSLFALFYIIRGFYETVYSFGEGYRIVFNVNDGALVNSKAINELIKKDETIWKTII